MHLSEWVGRFDCAGSDSDEPFACPLLSDEVLYNFILPSFESVFMGRSVHR